MVEKEMPLSSVFHPCPSVAKPCFLRRSSMRGKIKFAANLGAEGRRFPSGDRFRLSLVKICRRMTCFACNWSGSVGGWGLKFGILGVEIAEGDLQSAFRRREKKMALFDLNAGRI